MIFTFNLLITSEVVFCGSDLKESAGSAHKRPRELKNEFLSLGVPWGALFYIPGDVCFGLGERDENVILHF